MEKLIITAAICGAEAYKKDNANMPLSPLELADAAYGCYKAGASIIHLHVRDENGEPTQSKEIFAETIKLIKEKCPDIIVQPSTGGAVGMTAKERMQPLELDVEMATLTGGTVNFGDGVFYNSPQYIEQFATVMKERAIKPEIEVFEVGMIQNALRLVKKGLLKMPLHFDFVMGVPGAIPGTAKNLLHLVESIPKDCTWTVAGIGRAELPLATMAIVLGGNVRVGFEDNLYYRYKQLATSNAELVERIVRIANELDREIATPKEARKILGITHN
ncbi:3-keto-5-aminohexanoate cleavage protein [Clostridium sp. 'deep sea']|uniref:3-keto-5-aminohexanoate cleavage enzyme n=1 Tax=Clostridium sp. 'deep sea' TaxID=2779445 RepID=UPI0018965A81|nr:3-keto-5-aminohexanoate cleavage protein [Clostridium sp. 'deep sea']QOR34794.1 3-keto-5-aminohexanoate cleavage protein [Clostridium sp. 'deep sea']